jgi:uracil-DNA glycosylase family 4
VACERCPRLRRWCREVARTKVKRFRDQDYWGRPVPGFGDPAARLLVVGLAPAAHGGNRTGRVFTGDRSGDFLFAGLHRAGFASQPQSVARDDGLRLRDCYVTPVARCAPPANKPTAAEIARCREYLARERALLPNLRAVLVLGRIAMDGWLAMLRETEGPLPRRPAFAHGASHDLGHGLRLFCSYHVSQQNTFTGRLTPQSFDGVLASVKRYLGVALVAAVTAVLVSFWSAPASAEVRPGSFESAALGRSVSYVVDLPPGYEASGSRRYPVVYALHGLFEGPGFWERRGLAPILAELRAGGAVPEFLVVAVDGGNSFFVNAPGGRYEDMLKRDLVAHVESSYRVVAGRKGRALLGVSMGGYAALHIAFVEPAGEATGVGRRGGPPPPWPRTAQCCSSASPRRSRAPAAGTWPPSTRSSATRSTLRSGPRTTRSFRRARSTRRRYRPSSSTAGPRTAMASQKATASCTGSSTSAASPTSSSCRPATTATSSCGRSSRRA